MKRGYAGVEEKVTYVAVYTIRGVRIELGEFGTAKGAARAYDIFIKAHFGDREMTNVDLGLIDVADRDY